MPQITRGTLVLPGAGTIDGTASPTGTGGVLVRASDGSWSYVDVDLPSMQAELEYLRGLTRQLAAVLVDADVGLPPDSVVAEGEKDPLDAFSPEDFEDG